MPQASFLDTATEKITSFQIKEASDKVTYVTNKYNKYLDYFEDDRDRENENWKMFTGFEHGQWDAAHYAKLMSEGRHAGQYNFIRKKIETLASSLLRNWYDIDFVPVDGKYSDLTAMLKTLFYSDKEMLDWDLSYKLFLIDFLVYGGTEEMIISKRHSPFGNIGFERITPGHILFDPNWITDSGWDLNEAFKTSYMTPDKIASKYKIDTDEIKAQINMIQQNGPSYETTDFDNADLPYKDSNDAYGTTYKIIEDHYLVEDTKKKEYVFDNTGTMIEIPEKYTDEEKRQWVIFNDIDMTSGVIEQDVSFKKYKICAICPSLFFTKPLQEKESIIQIGRLPFVYSSSGRINGKNGGKIDDLKDIQQTINKRESLIEHIIANSANGGKFIDPEIVGNDYGKMEDLKANWNNPTYTEFSVPGEIASGRRHVEELPRSQFPSDAVNELTRMWELSDRLSPTPSAMDGRSEGSEDRSGILYARKQQQVEINGTMMLKTLERHCNEKGEMYQAFAPILYSGIYREFKKNGEQDIISINEEVDTEYGTITVNNIQDMPRHKVLVSQSPQGVTYREVQRSINSELLKYIPQQNPISRAIATANVMKSLDTSTQERQEYELGAELEKQLAYESIQTQIMGLQSQRATLEAQMQAAMNPQTQQQPAEGQEQEQPNMQEMQPQEANTPIG